MKRLKALPTWAKWTLGVVGLLVALGAVGGESENTAENQSPDRSEERSSAGQQAAARPAPVDTTTLFNSVVPVFIARYNEVYTDSKSQLSPDSRTFCPDDDKPVYSCEMRVDIPIFGDQAWWYDVTIDDDGCWHARTHRRYGAHQNLIEAYQNREAMAPSKAEIRRYIREANRLRFLKGCVANVPRATAGSSPEEFIAAYAAQNVQRERPGRQRDTTCDALGKQEVDFAPDSWDFACTTIMVDGRVWADKISCFDEPPYTSFDSCSEEEGYPKLPPRALPE